jgi:hypothetical protein
VALLARIEHDSEHNSSLSVPSIPSIFAQPTVERLFQ